MVRFDHDKTAPESAANALEGLDHRTTAEESITMAYPDPTAPFDGCPSCLRGNNRPVHVTEDADGHGVTALYRCAGCLHSWRTAWATGDGWGAA